MSFGVDVNILLYASDESCPQHAKASEFLRRCAEGREVFCLAWLTVMSYMRMATHPAIFSRPLSPTEAGQNIQALLALPHCRAIAEEEGFWEVFQDITKDVPVRGNLVPDAHLAAVLSQHGATTLYTHDKDFRKFRFLDVRDPMA
jgi:toxin-antitoxin system PIN domain toxin